MRLLIAIVLLALCCTHRSSAQTPPESAQRIVILKVDGLNAGVLAQFMRETNPDTGRSRLPRLANIFGQNGVIFDNFYTRGISLSAPSWSLLDTGHHLLIKGNVEYDRYTGRVYDYLNFFPFYLGYARSRQVDMPSVEVLDEAGVPMLVDAFPYQQRYQSFQLFQRGVRWNTLKQGLARRFSTRVLLSLLEDPQGGLGLGEGLSKQTEVELMRALQDPDIKYLDFFTGEIDHIGHSVNRPEAIHQELRRLDELTGRIWSAIQASPLAGQTLFAVVSDHGMNNAPGIYSQTFSLPDLLNSVQGGAHHVVTNRHQLSDYKIAGLDPLVSRVINPSSASLYLKGQSGEYSTAWLDLDGNERAAVSLRNSDLNRIHILLKQLESGDLGDEVRHAAAKYLGGLIDRHRTEWTRLVRDLKEELSALDSEIKLRRDEERQEPTRWTRDARKDGLDKVARRRAAELNDWIAERRNYQGYVEHLKSLLSLPLDGVSRLRLNLSDLVPAHSLGDPNTIYDLAHYVIGPGPNGLVTDANGNLDVSRSFRYVDYFPLFASQRVRNNPQNGMSSRPIDFMAASLPLTPVAAQLSDPSLALTQAIWLYADQEHQLVELVRSGPSAMEIRLLPVAQLSQDQSGVITWHDRPWASGFPFQLFEDEQLQLPPGSDRTEWLSSWHTEREWIDRVHGCRYSNGIVGITEELLPPSQALAATNNASSLLARFELRRRELVQPDFHMFAADHWNFNVRNFNPGGNHGSFLRISTHSVWMMAGASVPRGKHVAEPYDSLNFASTVLNMLGRPAPMPERIVHLP